MAAAWTRARTPAIVVCPEPVLLHTLKQRVGSGVGVAARGVVLEGGLEHGPVLPEPLYEPPRLSVGGHAGGHPPLPLEDALRAGEAVAGEVGSEQAVGGGLGGVELL